MPGIESRPPPASFLPNSSRSGSTFLASQVSKGFNVVVVPEFGDAYWLFGQPSERTVSRRQLSAVIDADRQAWAAAR